MVSSEDTSNKGIDASVGGLVWVRRRNGSWWPGQIADPEELPVNCLISPKSGTPVKLLGREDASVDWYNLEKSKRVKSFRCGEYDECIEKAKAAASNSSRKVVKYARREDAIIHALELESARLSNGHQDVCSKMEDLKDPESHNEESPSSVHSHDDSEEMADASTSNHESDSVLEISPSGVSFEDPSLFTSSKEKSARETRRRTPNDSEDDDGTEGVKRMRGLDDLGMVVASSFKRKRSQVVHVHEFLKKKRRRRPLAKVLENTMVTVPIMCEEPSVPTGSYLPGTYDSKVSELEYDETNTVVSCENGTLFNGPEAENQASGTVECRENGSSDKLFDVPLVAQDERNKPHYIISKDVETNCISQKMEKGAATEWQLKGKRNLRHSGKSKKQEDRSMDIDEESDGYLVAKNCKSRPISEIQLNEFKGWTRSHKEPLNTRVLTAAELPQRLMPYRQSRFSVNPKYDPSDFSIRHHLVDDSLYNVNVEVQSASCRPHHVPYISLMSKLSGRPIVGHPLTVEVLEDGFCDDLLSSSVLCSNQYEMDDDDEEMSDLPSGSVGKMATTKQSPKLRRNGVLSKKMRKLSSLTCSIRQIDEEEEESPKAQIEKLKGPAVPCIPLNIVFSRINAAFSGLIRPAIRRLVPDVS